MCVYVCVLRMDGSFKCARACVCLLDYVVDEGWVDKIAALGLWTFFSSYVCKLREKAIFYIWIWGNKKCPSVFRVGTVKAFMMEKYVFSK